MTTISIFSFDGAKYMLVSYFQQSGVEDLQLLRKQHIQDKGWKKFKLRGRNKVVAGRPFKWVKVKGTEFSSSQQHELLLRMGSEALLSDFKKIERSEEKLVIIACKE